MSPEAKAAACPQCGAPKERDEKTCGACGSPLVELLVWTEPAFERAWEETQGLPKPEPGAGRSVAAGWRGAVRAFSAAGATAFRLSTSPEAAFRSFRFEGPAAPPVLFVLAVGGPSLLLSVAWRAPAAPPGEPALSPLAAAAIFALLPPLYVYVRAQILHLSLVLRGRAVRSFTATFRVVSYSSGAVSPLLLLPFAGEVLFLAAGVVIEATGLRACHRLGPIEAAVLELLPAAIILLVLLATLPLGFFWWIHTRS